MELPCVPALPLSTPRLVLRAFTPDDADELLVFHGNPESVRYVPYPARDRDAVVQVLERKVNSTALRADGDLLELAAELATDGSVIGDLLVVVQSVEHGTVEIGYIFSPAHAGVGYATEAVRALVDLAVDLLGARRVVARVDVRNVQSRALLSRLGFRQEALLVENEVFKGELTSEADYAVLDREWRALRSAPSTT